MSAELAGKKIAFLVAPEGVEQVELTQPWRAVQDAGGSPVLVSTEAGAVQAFNHLDKGDTFQVDTTVAESGVHDFDALVLPGGVANPDFLRMQADVPRWVGSFFGASKPVAAICHAAWTLIEADVVSRRTLTSWPSLRTDLQNAGAIWVDEEVVVDRPEENAHRSGSVLISSRKPDDLKAFCQALIEEFSRSRG